MTKPVTTRFAPSPTGPLHLGHAFSALRAHDFARKRGGAFLLRIEDIDPARARAAHVEAIIADLRWLGIDWDGPIVFQSERLPLYITALERLRACGFVYPCFCTRADIAASASAPHGPDGPPSTSLGTGIYPGTCRKLDPVTREKRMASEAHAWRLDVARAAAVTGSLAWRDAIAGKVEARPEIHGDVVLARKDAPTSYHLAVTVDDAAQAISHVVRGADLFEATHIHRLLQALLGLPTPIYHHHALLTDAEGKRLAKRTNAPTIADLRAGGADPAALIDDLRNDRLPLGFALAGA